MSGTADKAWQLLSDGFTPQAIIRQLTPTTKAEAIHAARRLPLLAERPEGDRGAAMARIATRIGMRKFRLFFTPDGHIADRPAYNAPTANPATRKLTGDGCTVEYTRDCPDRDHFYFVGPPTGEPDRWGVVARKPHPMSPTGYWSHTAHPDAVIAMGGPEAYLGALQAAGRDGWKDFERAFTGEEPEVVRKPRKPVVGTHSARVVPPARRVELPMAEEPSPEPTRGGQRDLFSPPPSR